MCASPRKSNWFTRQFLLVRGWGLGTKLDNTHIMNCIRSSLLQQQLTGALTMSLHCSVVTQQLTGALTVPLHCSVVTLHTGALTMSLHCSVVNLHTGALTMSLHCSVVTLHTGALTMSLHCSVVTLHTGALTMSPSTVVWSPKVPPVILGTASGLVLPQPKAGPQFTVLLGPGLGAKWRKILQW